MITPAFSFLYNGTPFSELSPSVRETATGAVFTLPDGLTVELVSVRYPKYDAVEWKLFLSNNGTADSGRIEALYDCDVTVPFAQDPQRHPLLFPTREYTKIVATTGAKFYPRETSAAEEFRIQNNYILRGQKQSYAPGGGRSSDGMLPFFEVSAGDKGVLFAIGWTGQWNATFTRNDDGIRIVSGIEGVSFVLRPGEKISTTSSVMLSFTDGAEKAYNRFRRLLKELSPLGKGERPRYAQYAFEAFGGVSTENMLLRLDTLAENDIRFDYLWIDAGWYGDSEAPCPDPHTGNWASYTGNWYVNRNVHPAGLADVASRTEELGMKMLIWFEPERALKNTKLVQEHPEWFLTLPGKDNCLLNLGDPAALDGIENVLSGLFEELHVGCYRQDFNIQPLPYWRAADAEDRKGMTEIAYVNGLYTLWDRLLARFPSIIIDNCSGGGRRIDWETMKRAVPVWRTDYYCFMNANPDVVQAQQFGMQRFLPYSGGVTKKKSDTYAARSTYSAAWVGAYWCYDIMSLDAGDLAWAKKISDEYLRIRPYFDCDFYPLEDSGYSEGGWSAWQYDDPEKREGVVMAFRREESACSRAELPLRGLDPSKTYLFEDIDSGAAAGYSGRELLERGLTVEITERRSSKIILYRSMNG